MPGHVLNKLSRRKKKLDFFFFLFSKIQEPLKPQKGKKKKIK